MPDDLDQIRATPFRAVGEAIQRDAAGIIDRWQQRVRSEQPNARLVHHDVLLDHLPAFLWELGRSLSEANGEDLFCHVRPASIHGDQRWETGWSISEVIRDYQLLRLVLVEYLQEALERMLDGREVVALGVGIDDAIMSSVSAYLSCQQAREEPSAVTASGEISEVFSILGHELRNSLAPLASSLHILQLAGAEAETVERVRVLMERQVKVMSRLVEELMDVSRLARGKVSLKNGRLDLVCLVRQCCEDQAEAFREAEIDLQLSAPEAAVWTSGDATRLAQVMGNLLSNALKFSEPQGSVHVTLRPVPQQGYAEICVKDAGIGLAAADLQTIFQPFAQADRSMERTRTGLGLGLALVKGLTNLHGGRVRAQSQGRGSGAEFIVELPLIDSLRGGVAADVLELTDRAIPQRVLVIDDNQNLAETLGMVLELHGHQVSLAYSAADGLAAAHSVRPGVIICDLGLPLTNGYDVCRELAKEPALMGTLKIALSGHGSPAAAEQAIRAGFDAFLLKPIDHFEITRLIAERSRRSHPTG